MTRSRFVATQSARRETAQLAPQPVPRAGQVMSQEDQAYWAAVMESISRPQLQHFKEFIETSIPLGISRDVPKRKFRSAGPGRKPKEVRVKAKPKDMPYQLYEKRMEWKRQHPRHVQLVQVGKFYETAGIDAMVMMHYTGLNPMGNGLVPKAGLPVSTLPRYVAALNHANFSVIVYKEIKLTGMDRFTKGDKGIDRVVELTSTPGCPAFPEELAESAAGAGIGTELAPTVVPPIMGIAHSVRGFMLLEFNAAARTCMVHADLSVDTVGNRLLASGAAPPVRVHSSMRVKAGTRSDTDAVLSLLRRMAQGNEHGATAPYSGDPVTGFLDKVRRDELGADVPIHVVHAPVGSIDAASGAHQAHHGSRMQPLYLSSVVQLGLANVAGMPRIMDALLPPKTPAQCLVWMRRLLMAPPDYGHALLIREAVMWLVHSTQPLPLLHTATSPHKLAKLLESGGADAGFFRMLGAELLPGAAGLLADTLQLARCLVPYVVQTASAAATVQDTGEAALTQMLHELQADIEEIRSVVCMESSGGQVIRGRKEVEVEAGPAPVASPTAVRRTKARTKRDPAHVLPPEQRQQLTLEVVVEAHRELERFYTAAQRRMDGRVLPALISKQLCAIATAKAELEEVLLEKLLKPCVQEWLDAGTLLRTSQPTVRYAPLDGTIRLLVPGSFNTPERLAGTAWARALALKKGTTKSGREAKDQWSCGALEAKVFAYLDAVEQGTTAVRELLRGLSARLAPRKEGLLHALQLSVVTEALRLHVQHVGPQGRGWCVADMPPLPAPSTDIRSESSETSHGLSLQRFWPYWVDNRRPDVVANNLELGNMVLLTGPNMAGKSTLLRSVGAVALLANCGLMVPAASARVPWYDALMLRNFSGDSPLERKSSFALEMRDYMLLWREATPRSLVLLDEMGKGTEVLAGMAEGAVMLQHLCAKRTTGIFATHLHGLVQALELEHAAGVLSYMHMGTCEVAQPESGMWVTTSPTWAVQPGVCLQSLAFRAALKSGMRPQLVARMAELYGKRYPQLAGSLGVSATAPPVPAPAASSGVTGKTPSGPKPGIRATTSVAPAPVAVPAGGRDRPVLSVPPPAPPTVPSSPPAAGANNGLDAQGSGRSSVVPAAGRPTTQADAPAPSELTITSHGCDTPVTKATCTLSTHAPKDWQAAHQLMRETFVHVLSLPAASKPKRRSKAATLDAAGPEAARAVQVEPPAITTLSPRQAPPPSHATQCSVVYVWCKPRETGGWWYVGETDKLSTRLSTHRKKHGAGLYMSYMVVPVEAGGKTTAKKIEGQLINRLESAGFPMESTHDRAF